MRVSEVYKSVQGEGPRVGQATVFVRFAGCNLRCPGWPCDTPHAIDPKLYRHEWRTIGVFSLVDEITLFRTHNICYTGGEPLLQDKKNLLDLIRVLKQGGYHQEMFSNGTIKYPHGVFSEVDIIMDWKLPGSGEFDPVSEARWHNLHNMYLNGFGREHAVKFTIASRADYEAAKEVFQQMRARNLNVRVYYGVVWGKLENARLIAWVLEDDLPWTFNMQVHNHIWDRKERGI